MAKMTKAQMVAVLSEKNELSKKQIVAVLDSIFELALKEVKKNGMFTLADFGKLVKAKRAARTGRNPMTGVAIKIPAKTVVKFRLSKGVKVALLK